jgi:hypothetical protein
MIAAAAGAREAVRAAGELRWRLVPSLLALHLVAGLLERLLLLLRSISDADTTSRAARAG